jgi:hypothetical protein
VRVNGLEIGRAAATDGQGDPLAWSEYFERRRNGWTWAGPNTSWEIVPATVTALRCDAVVAGVAYRKCQRFDVVDLGLPGEPEAGFSAPGSSVVTTLQEYLANGRYLLTATTGNSVATADLFIAVNNVDADVRDEIMRAETGFGWPTAAHGSTPQTTWTLEWVSTAGPPTVCPTNLPARYEVSVDLQP